MACLLALALTLGCAGSSSAPPAGVPSSVEVAASSAPPAVAPVDAAEPLASPDAAGPVRGGLPAILPPDSSHSGGWQHYGAEFQLAADQALRCEELLAAPAAWEGRTVRVKGRVADVCQSAGCWMVLTPEGGGQGLVRITMKDHAFSVAKDGAGRQAELEGVLVGKAVDPATVAHYQSEAGAPGMVPEAQAQGGRSYEIVASAVRLRNPG